MKKLIALVLTVVFVLGLGACAAKEQAHAAHTPKPGRENVTEPENEGSAAAADGTDAADESADKSEIPGATRHVVDIWDRTIGEEIACDTALEKFWEDETTEYYFGCIKSQYIIVMDNTARTVDVVTALKEGLITVETLDDYGIGYFAAPKDYAAFAERIVGALQNEIVFAEEDVLTFFNGVLESIDIKSAETAEQLFRCIRNCRDVADMTGAALAPMALPIQINGRGVGTFDCIYADDPETGRFYCIVFAEEDVAAFRAYVMELEN